METIAVPHLGEGIVRATVAHIYVTPGDSVAVGDAVCDITTDKACFTIEAEKNGIIVDICVAKGVTLAVGDPVMYMDTVNKESEA